MSTQHAAEPEWLDNGDFVVDGVTFTESWGDSTSGNHFAIRKDRALVERTLAHLREHRPRRIVEIGSGQSTLMAILALRANRAEDPRYRCLHLCIEPYEAPWLERAGVAVLRRPVEAVPLQVFDTLEAGDVLFIDSSHMIRPQGDVLFEYLNVLPRLKPGVVVHVHDIFTPHDYPASWLVEHVRFWNEQYLLEAFLTHNRSWKVIGALNFLRHRHFEALSARLHDFQRAHEPGSSR